jgi:hypothetical protein
MAVIAPTNLHLTSKTATSISVAWSQDDGGPSTYATYKNGAVENSAISGTRRSYTYSGLAGNTSYELKICDADAAGACTETLTVKTDPLPKPVTNVKINTTLNSVGASWKRVQKQEAYTFSHYRVQFYDDTSILLHTENVNNIGIQFLDVSDKLDLWLGKNVKVYVRAEYTSASSADASSGYRIIGESIKPTGSTRALLYAKPTNRITRRLSGRAGHIRNIAMDDIIIKSNTVWHFETSAKWIHLDSTKSVNGDGVLSFSYDSYVSEVMGTVRIDWIRIIHSASGVVLGAISVSQDAAKASLFFSTTSGGAEIQPDILIDDGAALNTSFWVNSSSTEQWEILTRDTVGDSWLTVAGSTSSNGLFRKVGTGIVEIDIDAVASNYIGERSVEIVLRYVGSKNYSDIVTITQVKVGVKDTAGIICGGPGDWNVNIGYTTVKLNDIRFDGAYAKNKYNEDVERKIRYSQGHVTLYGNYSLIHYTDVYENKVDSHGNASIMEWAEHNHTTDNYGYKDRNQESGVWNVEASENTDGLLGMFAPFSITEKSIYSREIVEAMDANQNNAIFNTSVKIYPDDKPDQDIENPGVYQGPGIATVTLHNIFDPSVADPNMSLPKFRFDKYLTVNDAGKKADVNFSGNLDNPLNIISTTDQERIANANEHHWLKNNVMQTYFYSITAPTHRATHVKLQTERVISAKAVSIKDENGKTTAALSYSYEVVGIGYDDVAPANTFHGFDTRADRKSTITNDVLHISVNVEFLDPHPAKPDIKIGTSGRLSFRLDTDRKTRLNRWLTALEIFFYVIAALAVTIVTFNLAGPASFIMAAAVIIAKLALLWSVVNMVYSFVDITKRIWQASDTILIALGELFRTLTYGQIGASATIKPISCDSCNSSHSSIIDVKWLNKAGGILVIAAYLTEAVRLSVNFPKYIKPKNYDPQKWVAGVMVSTSV